MKLLRTAEVCRLTGISESTIRRLEHRDEFPKRVKISRGTVGWKSDEISAWIAALKAKPDPDEDDGESKCPHCGAPTEEKFSGDEGWTFCTDGCGCIEGDT
jgi:predicted DNA-binding transcriptional regulator AlpA